MRVVYSIGAKVGGGGIGTIAYHAVRGLHRHGLLHRLLCGSYRCADAMEERIRAIGAGSGAMRKLAVYDRTGRLSAWYNRLYDLWASAHLNRCDVFHGWNNHCLHTLRRASDVGAVTVVERASSHPVYHHRLLREEHARWGLPFRTPDAALERGLAELGEADFVLIPSGFVRESFRKVGVPTDNLIQISFGTDTQRFRPVARVHAGRPFRVLFVGQLIPRKGVPYLLESWKRLGWRNAEMWLVGRTTSALDDLLRPYRTLNGVRILPYVREPEAVYRDVDVFAFPTIEEGSALVVYEALASGLPVVTTPHAGSVVRNGEEGFVVPIRDVDALADRLERLRSDGGLREEMRRAARRRAEEFTWERYGDELAHALARAAGTEAGRT